MNPHRMKTILVAVTALAAALSLRAQMAPKTLDATIDLTPNGSATVSFAYSFDAGPWTAWKANVGDDPARTRASIRYNFGARVAFDDFKLERNDLNRSAKVTLHTAVAAELRSDGRYAFPVDKEFRLVNNIGGVWFFSGNVANTLSTIKVTLPEGAKDAALVDVGSSEQALVYTLPPRHGSARRFVVWGSGLLLVGLGLMAAAGMANRRSSSVQTEATVTR